MRYLICSVAIPVLCLAATPTLSQVIVQPSGAIQIGTATAPNNLTVNGTTNTNDLTINGTTNTNSLTVNNTVSTKELTVTGTTNTNNLTVNGTTNTNDLTVNGTMTSNQLKNTGAVANAPLPWNDQYWQGWNGGQGPTAPQYINVGVNTCPNNGVMVGAGLVQSGNRIAIQLVCSNPAP